MTVELSVSSEFYPYGKPEPLPPGRESILTLEAAIKALPAEQQVDLDAGLTHYFAPGVYARRLDRPAGTMVVGKIHKTEHLAIVLAGTMTIVDEYGSRMVTAPHVFLSKPGAKRATYAHTDASLLTIHPTDKTDLKEIEEEVVADSYEAFEQHLLEQRT